MKNAPLELGTYFVRLVCPDCGDGVTVGLDLVTVRQRSTDEGVTLRLKGKSSKVAHLCGQGRLELVEADG